MTAPSAAPGAPGTPMPLPMPGSADPLAGLRDWHPPDPVPWWPPAPGWWLLAAVGVGLLALALSRWGARRRRTAAARAALARLADLRAGLGSGGDARRFAAAVSALLRRVALARYPRELVAGLSGEPWLRFLDATGGGGGFCAGAGQALTEAPFRPPGSAPGPDTDALAALAARWIRANPGPPLGPGRGGGGGFAPGPAPKSEPDSESDPARRPGPESGPESGAQSGAQSGPGRARGGRGDARGGTTP